MKPIPSAALAALLCAAPLAHADIVVVTDRAAFLAALSSYGIDTFDDLSVTPTPNPLDRAAGPFRYRADSGPNSYFYPGGTDGGDVWLSTNQAYDHISFSEAAPPATAAGGYFFASDSSGQYLEGGVMVTATDGIDTVSYTVVNSAPTSFVGFLSTRPLLSITTDNNGEAHWPTVNDLVLGSVTAVPEPPAWALLIGGLCGISAWRRRRRG